MANQTSEKKNEPNLFSESISIIFILIFSLFYIYLSLLSVSVFLKFCYFHNVGRDFTGANAILGKVGMIFFSFLLLSPALGSLGVMLGTGKSGSYGASYWGSISFFYLLFVILRGIFFYHTIPKCLPAFPGAHPILGGVKGWEDEGMYVNGPPRLNPDIDETKDINWTREQGVLAQFKGFFNSLFRNSIKKNLGMKKIGDTCLVNNNCSKIIGSINSIAFLGNKYVGKYIIENSITEIKS